MSDQTPIDLPPIDPSLPTTLGGFLDEIAARFGPREAVAIDDALLGGVRVGWSYDELRRQSRRVAKALVAAGVGKGGRVGILLGNRPEFVAALFGVALAGGTAVTLSTFSTRDELDQLLHLSDIGVLLTQRGIARRSLEDEIAALVPALPNERFPFLQRIAALAGGSGDIVEPWDRFLAAGDAIADALLDARAARVGGNDEAVIIYTSGTTSVPKGVIHLHSTVIKQFRWQAEIYARHRDTRIASPFPLFWSAGIVSVLGSTLAVGGAYIADEIFEPGAALKLIARERIDEWYGFPTHTAALADHQDWPTADLSSMTRIKGNNEFAGHPNASPDPNWDHIVAYGMSESCTSVVSHLSTTPTALQLQSAGKPLPGIELRIIDVDDGRILDPGGEGEILVRGPTMMPHYVGMRREDSYDPEGFFHTGDTGFIDPDGFLHWTGRIKNMVKTGGANVASGEVEAVATALGSLKLCRVIGMPDKRLGEMVVLCAVKEEGAVVDEEQVRLALREKLAAYKVPKRVLFFAIDDYPLTASGKVKDKELRELAAARM
ncbi:class I adenylate-forming enzyme family protein [Sphingomonas bacterium]|uniref:class I adenylate-forming enzyme family protein n=1 Tax=Sphingomonas bacterium TaxID=1895847 RepID=UPI00157721D7|nr:class I adenylate-forming enzyme family protein [Sphingomonas bacterium]